MIQALLTDPDGNSVANAPVTITFGTQQATALTDGTGHLSISIIAPATTGTYTIVGAAAGILNGTPGACLRQDITVIAPTPTAIPTNTPVPTPTATPITTAAVRPVLECVVDQGSGSYLAWFGYKNENTGHVTIPIGTNNRFSPPPTDRGQPSLFIPGRQIKVFAVPFNGSNLVWTLKGPDGKGRTSTASSNSTRCTS